MVRDVTKLAAAAANAAAQVWAAVAWPQIPTLYLVVANAAAGIFLVDSFHKLLLSRASRHTPPDGSHEGQPQP